MNIVTIPRKEYEELQRKSKILDQLKNLDFDFISQLLQSKEDLRAGRFKRLA